jgi:DMSO reductase family type II enzyme chaperone
MMETIMVNHSVSQMYLFFARCFSYPEREFYEVIKGNEAQKELDAIVKGLPFEMNFKGIPSPSLPREEFECEYVNALDMTGGRTLYESAYTSYRDDMCSRDIYEDILRFYEHFNVKLNEREKDYPDHLTAELEFMSFLSKREADSKEKGKGAGSYHLAQLDFLDRHLNKWVHKLDEKIQKKIKEPFYKDASAFMLEFLRNHFSYLKGDNV